MHTRAQQTSCAVVPQAGQGPTGGGQRAAGRAAGAGGARTSTGLGSTWNWTMESTSLGSCSRPSSLRPRSLSVWLTPSLSGANSVTPLVGSLSVSARPPQLVSAAEQDAPPAPVQPMRSAGKQVWQAARRGGLQTAGLAGR
jgi:hypothetical protein